MDFELSLEQNDIQKAAREFAEKEFNKDYTLEIERSHQFPWKVFKRACELGFAGIDIPEEYGGQGYGLLERVLVTEAFSRSGAGVGMHASHPGLGIEIILWFGTDDQKKTRIFHLCARVKPSWHLRLQNRIEEVIWSVPPFPRRQSERMNTIL